MKKNKWILYLGIVSFLGTFLIYKRLPEQIPIHWGINGEVDNYGSRMMALVTGIMPVGLYLLMLYLPKIDPRRENYAKHSGAYGVMQMSIVLFFIVIHWAIMYFSLGNTFNIGRLVTIGIGILFIIIGNYMSQIRHNYFIGIKTPWTLASEYVWKKTHRLGGIVFIISGILMGLSTFIDYKFSGTIIVVLIIGMITGLYLYSYLVFNKNERSK